MKAKRWLLALLLLSLPAPARVDGYQLSQNSKEAAEAEPVQTLHRFPAEPFGVALGAPVTQVIEALWHWYDSPITLKRDVLDLAGAIKVNGKAQEFSLEIRQSGEQQIYTLRLEGAPETSWVVSSLSDSEILVEFTVAKSGATPARSGQFRVERTERQE